jgi:hypothetical protein
MIGNEGYWKDEVNWRDVRYLKNLNFERFEVDLTNLSGVGILWYLRRMWGLFQAKRV